ncbi:MAG: hypothetical protein ACR2M4_13715 [Actinomycetota bacterium]
MPAPRLSVAVQPKDGPSMIVGPLAARTVHDSPQAQLSLILRITNLEAAEVHLTAITISFAPPVIGSRIYSVDLMIQPRSTALWRFEPEKRIDNIILPVPMPTSLSIGLTCEDFSDSAVASHPLVTYASPLPSSGYIFPALASELSPGEYWQGRSGWHGSAPDGTQLFGYDFHVRALDVANQWVDGVPSR